MAVMWPRKLPEWVLQDPRRSAEREVYRQLESLLSDDWSVYYSRPWWGITPKGAEIDGEADFIVANPSLGVLFLEVKGGRVEFDPKFGEWLSQDRNGIRHKIKDPVIQSTSAKHQLLRKFQQSNNWPKHRVRLRHGVIFPNCEPIRNGLIGSYEQELFCCATEFRDSFYNWILKRLTLHPITDTQSESGPGLDGIAAIDSVIAAPARLSVPLHRQLSSDIDRQDELLTGAQLFAVCSIDSSSRSVVEGGAGTGKTLIGCELALRYAREGRLTLFCCLSAALASSVDLKIGKFEKLDVFTISELEKQNQDGTLKSYDAVIVDEGQDVTWEQWDLFDQIVADKNSLLRVLFDSNQAIYRARDDLETRLQAQSFPLRLNIRNTKQIAVVTDGLYRGPLIHCGGTDGVSPVILDVPFAKSITKCVDVVIDLLEQKKILPVDISVLVPNSKTLLEVSSQLLTARVKVTDAISRLGGCITVETVGRFKGLESTAIVLVLDRETANSRELSYVGVSRARALLIIIGPINETLLHKAATNG
jgi:hypothetical protein